MNKLILFTFLLLASISYSQNYDAKIQELNQQLESAISNEDFEKAESIKQERDLYVELKEAINNEDFQRASKIKKEITGKPIRNKSNSNTNLPEDCIVYFYAGKNVGPIGGYVSNADIDNISIRKNEVKKVVINSGIRTFITNWSEQQAELTRNFEPGKIYFIEFNDYMGNKVQRPTLRFVNQSTFLRSTNFLEELPKEYVIKDVDKLKNESILNFTSNINCRKCHLEINGTRILSGITKKTIYSIGIPADEIVITLITELFEEWSNFNTITVNDSNSQYIEAQFAKVGFGVQQVELNEVSRDDFKSNTSSYTTVILNQ